MNKILIFRKALAFLIIILFSCSCDLFKNSWLNNGIKDINVTIAYKTPIYADTNQRMEIENNIVYITEKGILGLCAINMDNGEIIWRKENFYYTETNAIKDDNSLYFMREPDNRYDKVYLIEVNSNNGELLDSYKIGENIDWRVRMYSLDLYKNRIYWGNLGHFSEERGLVYFDTETKEYGFCYRCGREEIMNNIIAEDNVIYLIKSYSCDDFPDYDPYNPEYYPVLVALKTDETDDNGEYKVKWELKDKGVSIFPTNNAIMGNRLYVGNLCIDKETGKIIWRNEEFWGWTTYYNGRFYSQTCAYDKYKFYCMDANTGETIWKIKLDGDMDKYSDSCDINPQVNEGYVYYITYDCMIVVDDRRGCVVGVDPKVRAGMLANGRSVRYKDLMLFKSLEGYLYAVKMDMHTRGL